MVNKKGTTIATFILIIISILFLMLLYNREKSGVTYNKNEPEYAQSIFGDEVMNINIIADQNIWEEMLKTADKNMYYPCDIEINGKRVNNVGIRVKGNSSLSSIRMDDSNDRFSFRIKFDEYQKGQTFDGLDSMSLNNVMGDSTYMKEYISFDIMKYIGVDTPYVSYSNIMVNNENWGFYLAIESYNDSFIARNYNKTDGELYSIKTSEQMAEPNSATSKPDDLGMQQGGMPKMEDLNFDVQGAMSIIMESGGEITDDVRAKLIVIGLNDQDITKLLEMTKNGMNPIGQNAKGNDLVYIDDEYESYSSIFDNAITKPTEKDYDQVIEAIKNLNEGTNLEKYYDVDKIIRYLAAHTFVVNSDSYYGAMCQNYVIYEEGGKLTILPWDYGLAFGGMGNIPMGNNEAKTDSATSFVNSPIDTPLLASVNPEDRPLVTAFLENEEYKNKYHHYLQQIVDGYFGEGLFENKIDEREKTISEYVKNDKTAFITYNEFIEAVATFKDIVRLRADSINGQLKGEIPSTTETQSKNPEKLINASMYDMNNLGVFMEMKNNEVDVDLNTINMQR